ncbi:MAG: IS200/IS605 family element transposase accessory protein TnpB [Halobacteriovoraceae bacterium]|nr:IS200/IS605 family element transposase accessory protein TnpB [Halobacteriovoraceae bacterium]
MRMYALAHKIELKPTNKQVTYFKKASGIARFTWNWALASWNEYYLFNQNLPKDDRDSINGLMLKKEFNAIKKQDYPWVGEVSKYVCQQPFIQLNHAYSRFFKGLAHKPKFKKKNVSRDSFYIGGDQIKVKNKKVWVPNLGFVRLKEELRFKGKIRSATFSRKANRWFVSIQVDTEVNIKNKLKDNSVGVDLGVNSLIHTSDNIKVSAPKPLKQNLRVLKRQQRKLAKKTFNSSNYHKQKLKVEKTHLKIANTRKDNLHKITHFLTQNYKKIAIEDLNVKGMLKNHKLARAISDLGFYELRRQLKYKSALNDNVLFVADRFYPSSKKCGRCGKIKNDLKLKDRRYKCSHCGLDIDRDLNAAINLESFVNHRIRGAASEFTPKEMTAIDLWKLSKDKTSIDELGNEHQNYVSSFG